MKKIVVISALASLLWGCGPTPTPVNTIKPIDKATVAAVQMGFKSDTEMATYDIKVSAKLDHLVLSGTVGSEEAKKKAEEMASKTPSVNHVDNNLTVSE